MNEPIEMELPQPNEQVGFPPMHLLEAGPQTSSEVGALMSALAKAQAEMLVVSEDSTNPHYGSGYASLAAVRRACAPLSKHGIAILQMPHGSKRLITVLALGDQWLSCCTGIESQRAGPQAYGSALTYARRYALMSLIGLAPADDDGNAAQAQVSNQAPRPPSRGNRPTNSPTPLQEAITEVKSRPAQGWTPTQPQLKRLFAIAKSHEVEMDDIRALMRQMWGVESTSALSKNQYDQLCADLIPKIAAGGGVVVDTSTIPIEQLPDDDIPF